MTPSFCSISRWSLASTTALGVLGCELSAPPSPPVVAVPSPALGDVDPLAPAASPPASRQLQTPSREVGASAPELTPLACSASPASWAFSPLSLVYGPAMARYTPLGQFLVASGPFGGPVLHTFTGEITGQVADSWTPDGVSQDWTLQTSNAPWGEGFSVSWFASPEPVVTLDSSWAPTAEHTVLQASGVLLQPGIPYGAMGVAIGCWFPASGGGEPLARLYVIRDAVYTFPYATEVAELTSDVCTSSAWGNGFHRARAMRAVPGQTAVVFASHATGTVTHFDIATGALTQRTLSLGAPSELSRFVSAGDEGFVSTSVSPNGDLVALSHEDGTVRVLTLPALEDAAPPLEAGIALANRATYMPSVESPVAWSPDGGLLLHVSPSGDVVARRTDDWSVSQTFPLGDIERPAWVAAEDAEPLVPMAMAFADGGSRFAVVYDGGIAQWTCGPTTAPTAPAPGDYIVELQDTDVHVGTASAWQVWQVDGHWQPVRLVSWTVDGVLQRAPTFSAASTSLWFETPGLHHVGVEIDDGFSVVAADAWVDVLP